MAVVMRALIALWALLLCLPAHAEPVTAALTWIGSAVGASAASAYAVGAFIVTTAVSIGTTAYANSQTKKRARQEAARKLAQDIANLSDRRATLLQSDAPHTVIYGEPGRVGGSIVGMLATGVGNQHTHIIMAFASHPCEAIDEIYIDDDPVQADAEGWTTNAALMKESSAPLDLIDIGPMVHISLHLSPGGVDVADQWLIDQVEDPVGGFPGRNLWTADHKLSGYTYAVITVNKVLDRFQGGPPNITAKIRGKNTIYDPRTGERGYSRNPALCAADFIMSEEGYGASLDQIDTAALIVAANACDQEVYGPEADDDAVNYGNSRALYVCDGMFRSDQDRDSTRQQIEESMCGFSLQSAGVWRIQAGAWSTPVMALGDADMLAPMAVVQTANPGSRVYNTARGTYINAARNGVSEDFAQYQNGVFLGLDPHEKITDMALAFTASHVRCHQIARVTVERSRGGMVLRINPKMKAWHLQPGDRILLSSVFYDFEDKPFIVTDWSYSREAPLTLEVLEDVPAYYDTADEVLADAAPNTNLPNPFAALAAPTGLAVEPERVLQGASTVLRARVTWDRALDARVLVGGAVRVQWRPYVAPGSPETGYQTADLPGDSTEAIILGLDAGQSYTVRVQFATAFVRSPWAWMERLIEVLEPPADVDGLALSVEPTGIQARWSAPVGIDLAEWDRTLVGRGATGEAALDDVRFDGHATSANLGWFPAGSQTVWAVHHSRAGQWSEPVSAGITIAPPAAPVVTGRAQGRTVALAWQDCTTTQPIREYVVRLGADLGSAVEIERTPALSLSRVELTAGLLHVYWVSALDMGGNAGPWASVQVMTLPDLTDPIQIDDRIDEHIERVRDRVEWAHDKVDELRDAMAADAIRVALRGEAAVTHARERLGGDIDAVATVVETTRNEVVTATSALAQQIDLVAAQAGGNIAAAMTAIDALVDEQQAQATQYTTLTAEFAANKATVTHDLQALATADTAQANATTALTSTVNGNHAYATNSLSTLSTTQSAQATAITGISTTVGNNHAQVTSQMNTMSTTVSAQATQLTTVAAQTETNRAGLVSEITARTDAVSAVVTSVNVVSAVANRTVSYRQPNAPTGSQLKVGDLWADTDDNNKLYRWGGSAWVLIEDGRIPQAQAAILLEQTTRANGDTANANSIFALTSRVDDGEAAIIEERDTRVAVDSAHAGLINTLRADVGFISARYVEQATVTATVNGAIATYDTTLRSSVGALGMLSATVATNQNTFADLNGNIAAQHMLRTELVGSTGKRALAGIKVGVSSSNGGTDVQSEIVLLAGSVQVANRLTPGGSVVPLLKVEGDVAYLEKARIKDADIDTLKIAGQAVSVLATLVGNTPNLSMNYTVPGTESIPVKVLAIASTVGFNSIAGTLTLNVGGHGTATPGWAGSAMAAGATVVLSPGTHTITADCSLPVASGGMYLQVDGSRR